MGNGPRLSALLKRSGTGNASNQFGELLTFFPIGTIHLLVYASFGRTEFLPYFAILACSARLMALPNDLGLVPLLLRPTVGLQH